MMIDYKKAEEVIGECLGADGFSLAVDPDHDSLQVYILLKVPMSDLVNNKQSFLKNMLEVIKRIADRLPNIYLDEIHTLEREVKDAKMEIDKLKLDIERAKMQNDVLSSELKASGEEKEKTGTLKDGNILTVRGEDFLVINGSIKRL